jgi:hypothetical protein
LKRLLILGLFPLAAVIAVVAAQPGVDEPYHFVLDEDITDVASDVVISPRSRILADDRFEYEIDFKALRQGSTQADAEEIGAFRRSEHWANHVLYIAEEDELEGRRDLRLTMQFVSLHFLLDLGEARYSGYIGPEDAGFRSAFQEVLPGGRRNEVTNIPGWPGINARELNTRREAQNRIGAGAAWFSISELSRIHNELYFADYNSAPQTNYPSRLQDPLQLTLGLFPQFAEDAEIKIGDSMTVRRRFPLGPRPGATAEYEFQYRLERLYGTIEEPTAARFTFNAQPVERSHEERVDGLIATYDAPEIRGGRLLLDLRKGIPVHVSWSYTVSGSIAEEGKAAEFENKVDFTASLRSPRAIAD